MAQTCRMTSQFNSILVRGGQPAPGVVQTVRTTARKQPLVHVFPPLRLQTQR